MTSDRADPAALRARFLTDLPDPVLKAIDRIVAAGTDGGGVYVAAGIVRDLLLGRTPVDVDLITEGDAPQIAARAMPDAAITTHDRFRTATIELGPYRIDLATARRETYTQPGALPDVEPADIEEDLGRRDFSINALALRLDGPPALLDPCGGLSDLDVHLVRVLHDASFQDDATRIFRAFRYSTRLGFTIEPHTSDLLRDGIRFIATIGGERLRNELVLLLAEETGGRALEACEDAGALAAIHRSLRWSAEASIALAAPPEDVDRFEFGFALMARGASSDDAATMAERLRLTRGEAEAVRGVAALAGVAETLRRSEAKPSGVVTVLDRYRQASIAAYAALTDDNVLSQVLHRYLDEWRHAKPILNGNDLMELGVPQGPQVKRGLQLIRAARLDGWADDRDDERALILRFAKSIRDSRAMQQPIDFKFNGN